MLKHQHFPSRVGKGASEVKGAMGLLQQPVEHHLPVVRADGYPEPDAPTAVTVVSCP